LSYRTGLLALTLAAACGLVVFGHLSPPVLFALLGSAAIIRAAATFRREQDKVDRILSEELDLPDDQTGAPVEITAGREGPSFAPVSSPPVTCAERPERQRHTTRADTHHGRV
jgi:hypothetical protein